MTRVAMIWFGLMYSTLVCSLMCYLGAHQFGTTICEINLGSWHKGSRSTWWREKHKFCPTKTGPSRQPWQGDPLPLKLWTVLLNCGIDFRFGIHPCSGLGVSLKDQTFGSSLAFFFSFVFFLVGFLLSVFLLLFCLLLIFQNCWASRHHGCWVRWSTFEIELHPPLGADEVSEDVMRTGHYRSCCC